MIAKVIYVFDGCKNNPHIYAIYKSVCKSLLVIESDDVFNQELLYKSFLKNSSCFMKLWVLFVTAVIYKETKIVS